MLSYMHSGVNITNLAKIRISDRVKYPLLKKPYAKISESIKISWNANATSRKI